MFLDASEYVMVIAGEGGEEEGYGESPKTEILNLGCPSFECSNTDLPQLRSTSYPAGGVIADTPIICGGEKMPKTEEGGVPFGECFKLAKSNGMYRWDELEGTFPEPKLHTLVNTFLFQMLWTFQE